MPPKPKCTREEIISAALSIVSQHGSGALTAKALGAALKTSATPIFTVFSSMQEVAEAVKLAAMERFESYTHKIEIGVPIFKQIGMQMVLFAKEEPQGHDRPFSKTTKSSARSLKVFRMLEQSFFRSTA